ncbi:MAG: hypothetical protein M5U34_17980 [Chloroflexi bacterium]|nr:hypothetical protein [Chloroflexota bacterium]
MALMGIGHELRGDDAAGVAVIRSLAHLLSPTPSKMCCWWRQPTPLKIIPVLSVNFPRSRDSY